MCCKGWNKEVQDVLGKKGEINVLLGLGESMLAMRFLLVKKGNKDIIRNKEWIYGGLTD